MRLGQLPLVALAVAALASCGGVENGMAISISRAGLSPGAARAWVRVHVRERSCDDVKSSGHDKRASYKGDFTIGSGGAVVSEIRPGVYTVAVWTFTAEMQPLDFGCKDSVNIKDGEMTEVPIDLAAL
jgi:hypothetical protein